MTTKRFALCHDCMAMLAIDYDLGLKETTNAGTEAEAESAAAASAAAAAAGGQDGAAAGGNAARAARVEPDVRIELLDGNNSSRVLAYAYPVAKPPKQPRWWKRSRIDGRNRTAAVSAEGAAEGSGQSRESSATRSAGYGRRLRADEAAAAAAAAAATSAPARQRATIVRWLPAGARRADGGAPDDAFWRSQTYRTRRASPDHLLPTAVKRLPGVRQPKPPNFGLREGQFVRLRLKLYGAAKLYSFQWIK